MRSFIRPYSSRLLLCLFFSFTVAQACGPDFSPDIFVRPNRPDQPREYVTGKLGLLQPSFARADLLVAYRYLNGGSLDATEQKGWSPTYSPSEPEWGQSVEIQVCPYDCNGAPSAASVVGRWVSARNAYPDATLGKIEQERKISISNNGYTYQGGFLNCADDAFRTATATLADRAAKWGSGSDNLRDWVRAQDVVFANCPGGKAMPDAAPAGSPALLVSDRAYQTAAANFYSMDFPAASEQFLALSKDGNSPWQPLAGYLAARAMVRQAFLSRMNVTGEQADYDPALMKAAAAQLRSYLAANPPAEMRKAAEAELALVRIRIEPEERMRELSALLSGPAHDANYAQNMQDLLWILDAKTPDGLRAKPEFWDQVADETHPGQTRTITRAEAESAAMSKRESAYKATAAIRAQGALIDWALTVQSLDPAAGTHALEKWRRTQTLPWLVAALMLFPDNQAAPLPLLEAAAKVPPDSPAWQTTTYHRVRLLLAAGQAEEARRVLSDSLERVKQEGESSSINAFRGLGMQAAPDLPGFLEFAARTTLLLTSEEESSVGECREVMKNPNRHYNCVASIDQEQIDQDAAGILNTRAPLSVWLAAARSTARSGALPQQLRQAIAMSGWTRAALLKDSAAAKEFVPLLPEELRTQAGDGVGFEQQLVLVRNPGLSPYLNGGTQRAYSYDFVESYRDNWCYKAPEDPTDEAAFLSSAERKAGAQQGKALAAMSAGTLGQEVVAYVQANPNEARAAEALFLVLRMIRYGCTEAAPAVSATTIAPDGQQVPALAYFHYSDEALRLRDVKQEAARLLRRRYSASPWTKKAAPFAG